jgi:hypothetical protein
MALSSICAGLFFDSLAEVNREYHVSEAYVGFGLLLLDQN